MAETVNNIHEATKDCLRDDCSISAVGPSRSTLMAWTPTYDKHGNRIDRGDPNIHSTTMRCWTCGSEWLLSTQYGETKVTK